MPQWINRKTALIATLLVLVVAAGYLNVRLGQEGTASAYSPVAAPAATTAPTPAPAAKTSASATPSAAPASSPATAAATGNFFEDYRVERVSARTQEIAWLDEMLADASTTAQSRREAEQMKLSLVKWMDIETSCAGVLRAKGFADAIVTMREGTVNVIIKASKIADADAVKIMELCVRETGEKADNIKILMAQ